MANVKSEKADSRDELHLTAKDLALVLGCKCYDSYNNIGRVTLDTKLLANQEFAGHPDIYIKPILRPLSEITEKEAMSLLNDEKGILAEFDSWHYNGDNLRGFFYRKTYINKGALAYTGGILFSSLSPLRTKKLLAMHFDLFGWIDARLAIDATSLNPNPYNMEES